MSIPIEVPAFSNEEEEARWWHEHEATLAQSFDQAAANGTLRRSTLQQRRQEAASRSVLLDPADAALAHELAERSGEPFENYVKRVMHRALLLEKSA